jgi:hypothetical protein
MARQLFRLRDADTGAATIRFYYAQSQADYSTMQTRKSAASLSRPGNGWTTVLTEMGGCKLCGDPGASNTGDGWCCIEGRGPEVATDIPGSSTSCTQLTGRTGLHRTSCYFTYRRVP